MGYSLNNTTDNKKGMKRKNCAEKNIVLLWELVRNHELCVPAPFQKIPSSFAVKASVMMQTAYQNAKN